MAANDTSRGPHHATRHIASSLGQTIESVGQLLLAHARQARDEVVSDLRSHRGSLAALLVFAAIGLLGYLLVMMGAAVALGAVVGPGTALLLVGGLNLLCAAWAGRTLVRRLGKATLLGKTTAEIERSLALVRLAGSVRIDDVADPERGYDA